MHCARTVEYLLAESTLSKKSGDNVTVVFIAFRQFQDTVKTQTAPGSKARPFLSPQQPKSRLAPPPSSHKK